MNDNEIIIKYKVKNEEKIKLFGYSFVELNKNKCKLKINNITSELKEYYTIENELNLTELEIKLIGINNIILAICLMDVNHYYQYLIIGIPLKLHI